jgi:hypothetical protein
VSELVAGFAAIGRATMPIYRAIAALMWVALQVAAPVVALAVAAALGAAIV